LVEDDELRRLLSRLSSGDNSNAWAEFLRAYSDLIYETDWFMFRDLDSASDCYLYACQELSRHNFRRLVKFQPDGSASFPTWLRVVVRHLYIDWYRKKRGAARTLAEQSPDLSEFRSDGSGELQNCTHFGESSDTSSRETGPDEYGSNVAERIPDCRPSAETAMVEAERQERVQQVVESLPASEKFLLDLRFSRELSLAEVGRLATLGTPQQVQRRIDAILEKLRRKLK